MSADALPRGRRAKYQLHAVALISVLCTVIGTGCRRHAPAAAVSNESTNGLKLELTVTADDPRMVRPATFSVHITDSAGKPVENARATGSLNMVLMDMGKIEVQFGPKGNGDYEVTVKCFDMSGPWELSVDAVQSAVRAHKVFKITVLD